MARRAARARAQRSVHPASAALRARCARRVHSRPPRYGCTRASASACCRGAGYLISRPDSTGMDGLHSHCGEHLSARCARCDGWRRQCVKRGTGTIPVAQRWVGRCHVIIRTRPGGPGGPGSAPSGLGFRGRPWRGRASAPSAPRYEIRPTENESRAFFVRSLTSESHPATSPGTREAREISCLMPLCACAVRCQLPAAGPHRSSDPAKALRAWQRHGCLGGTAGGSPMGDGPPAARALRLSHANSPCVRARASTSTCRGPRNTRRTPHAGAAPLARRHRCAIGTRRRAAFSGGRPWRRQRRGCL